MHRKHKKTRFAAAWTALTAAGALLLVLAAGAAAVVYVYSNNFKSKTDYQEIKQVGGGKDCADAHRQRARAIRISARSDNFCEYSPPVTGDAGQPDQQVVAAGQVLKATPRALRKASYLAVRVRVGGGTHYQLLVRPVQREYRLTRSPAVAGLPMEGVSNAIRRVGERNKLLLKVDGNAVRAVVNGRAVASFTDPNPGQVDGRRVSFGLGSTKNARLAPVGTFNAVRVGIP